MQLDNGHKALTKCAAKSEGRYRMTELRLERAPIATGVENEDRGVLVATDGRRIVALPVTLDEADTDGFVTCEAFETACKRTNRYGFAQLTANGKLELANGQSFTRTTEGEFPRWRDALPKFARGDEGTMSVSFNAKYLAEIAKALNARDEIVTLTFETAGRNASTKPILVKASNCSGVGALMPCTVEG